MALKTIGGFKVDESDLDKTNPSLRGIFVVPELSNNSSKSMNYDTYVRDLFKSRGAPISWVNERDIEDKAVNVDSAMGSDMEPDYRSLIKTLPTVNMTKRWMIYHETYGDHSDMRKYSKTKALVLEIVSGKYD